MSNENIFDRIVDAIVEFKIRSECEPKEIHVNRKISLEMQNNRECLPYWSAENKQNGLLPFIGLKVIVGDVISGENEIIIK